MKLIERFRAAYQGWQGKALPPFNAFGGSGVWAGWPSFSGYPGTNINYSSEVGPLTGSSLIMAAVNWTGTTLPEAPIQVLRRNAEGDYEAVPGHPMLALLDRPNPYYSGELLLKAFGLSWIIDGNSYLLKNRNAGGQVVELWYEPHFSCRPRWKSDGSDFISYYEVKRDGRWYEVPVEDVIHFRYGIDPYNPRLGLSPVGSIMREIFTDSERARYSALVLKNGGVVPFVMTPENSGTLIDPVEVKREWEYRTSGDNLGKPMVLSNPVKIQEIGTTPDKLLVEKASLIPEARLAAVIGIPAAVLGFTAGMEQTKVGATMRELREQAYESFLIPTQRLIAAELKVQLLSEFPSEPGDKVAFDLSQVRVLQEDQRAMVEREAMAYEKGIKTRGEVRAALGLEVTEDDDVYFVEPGEAIEDPVFEDDEDETKAAPLTSIIGSKQEAQEWWERNAPDDAKGMITAKRIA